ncbi:MAG: glycosyltransferase family protein [Rickettsiales bacterium]
MLSSAPSIAKPQQGLPPYKSRLERVLLLCYYDPNGISTIPETVSNMQAISGFQMTVLNLFEHRIGLGYLTLGENSVDLNDFSAVVIHNTVSYNVDNIRALDGQLATKFRDYTGLKVLMKQDENHRFRELAAYIGETGFDVIFTCLPPAAVPLVYPPHIVGNPRFERMLTGYVTPTLRALRPGSASRPIDIGYRGSLQPLNFGRLAYEKRKIGDDIKEKLAGSGLNLDISSRWEDRFGGDAWFDFLGSCKATLGAESGASIFDLNGDLKERCSAISARLGPDRDDAAFAEAYLAELADLEDNIHYHQISPRHLEAAATGTIQLLYPGDYSGLLIAGRHYFTLERDYSNLDEAVALIRDDRARTVMAQAAYDEVVHNPINWIETFVARFDNILDEEMARKNIRATSSITWDDNSHHVLLIAAHEPRVDPRLAWITRNAPAGMRIHQLGVLPPLSPLSEVEERQPQGLYLAMPRQGWRCEKINEWANMVSRNPSGIAALHQLTFIHHATKLRDEEFCDLFGAPQKNERIIQFRWYLNYLLDSTYTLIEQATRLRGIQALIATDLETLMPALLLKSMFNIPVFYDAHEYWPESDVASLEFEKQFWVTLEAHLTPYADYRQTVSPNLAQVMSDLYHVPFNATPNCEPLSSLRPFTPRAPGATCTFLFQGNFAPGRGIELLIEAWADTDLSAILWLRGPDGEEKEKMKAIATATGLMGTRIFFPDAVAEEDLIAAAAEADVGLIPYTPVTMGYKYCCPNKTSQYMAAGIPILANITKYVEKVVKESGAGKVANFAHRGALVTAVNELVRHPETRQQMAKAGHDYFQSTFNWNAQSTGFYSAIEQKVAPTAAAALQLFPYHDSAAKKTAKVCVPRSVALPSASTLIPTFRLFSFRVLRYGWSLLPNAATKRLLPYAQYFFRKYYLG